jgi:hypothetical protein
LLPRIATSHLAQLLVVSANSRVTHWNNEVHKELTAPVVAFGELNTTYSECLGHLVTAMLRVAQVTNEDLFVDIGSGMGTVVAQAALEYGCKTVGVGVEVVPTRADYGTAFLRELVGRIKAWNLSCGSIQLIQDDAAQSDTVANILEQATVVFLANTKFTSQCEIHCVALRIKWLSIVSEQCVERVACNSPSNRVPCYLP